MKDRHRQMVDGALAVAALAAVEVQLGGRWPDPVVVIAAAAWVAGLLARHRLRLSPLAGPLALAAAARLDPTWTPRFVEFLSILLAGWLMGWSMPHSGPRRFSLDIAASVAVIWLAVMEIGGRPAVDAAYLSLFGAAALLLGRLAAGYKAELDAKQFQLETNDVERAAQVERAAAEARASMAAELHDIVGHSVGAMTLQAGAARVKLEAGDVAAAYEALLAVETAGHAALVDLRRMLGVLRSDMASVS